MIQIEILNSPDQEMLGKHIVFFDSLLLGSSSRCSLVIDDPKLSSRHLKISVAENGVLCSNIGNAKSYHSNKKKVSGDKLHKKEDLIAIGETEFRILDFAQTDPSAVKVRELYEKVLEKNPELETILYYLERELLYIEQEKHAD